MALTVDFITLGDVASRLDVPSPTLRHWTDQMEEFNVHYVLRNNRNERIYEESDIEIFAELRDLKNKYGRKTTSRDLGAMLVEKGKLGELKLRSREDAPLPDIISQRTYDLMNHEEIKRIFEDPKAKQVIEYIVNEATKDIRDNLMNEVREAVRAEVKAEMEEGQAVVKDHLEKMEETLRKKEEANTKLMEEMKKQMEEQANKPKGFLARMFGG